MWEKIELEAIRDNRTPLLVVDLEDKNRLVVFSPKYFDRANYVDLCSINPPPKSVRIKYSDVGFDEFGDYTFTRCITICGKKRNLLCYMRIEDFIEAFKEEL